MSERPAPRIRVDEPSPEELACNARDGVYTAFEALVSRFGPPLLRYLRHRVRSEDIAEDLVQETFLKVYRNLWQYDPRRRFTPWLYTIATRVAANYTRRQRPGVLPDGIDVPDREQDRPDAIAARTEQREGLWATARSVLPDSQFTVLWMRYAEDLPISDVCRIVGKSNAHVRVLLYRARRKLMQAVEAPPGAERPADGADDADGCALETTQ